jgi:hypothetical protein
MRKIENSKDTYPVRAFGKDITNQVKIVDKKMLEYLDNRKINYQKVNIEVVSNQNINEANLGCKVTRVVRGRNQSMDDNILKNFCQKEKDLKFSLKNSLVDSRIPIIDLRDSNSNDVQMKTFSPIVEEIIFVDIPRNTNAIEEYVDDIYNSLLQEELLVSRYDYMPFQDQINIKMRTILVDWLVDVTQKFKLRDETLFLTVSLIDKYLSTKRITRHKYQLLGACSLLIACKIEEIFYPELRDLEYICDKAYSKEEIIVFETEILKAIDYKIVPATCKRFFEIIAMKLKLSGFELHFCNMILELSLVEYQLAKILPSLIAVSAVYITLKIKKNENFECINKIEKFVNFFYFQSFPESEIKQCSQLLCSLLDNIHTDHIRKIKLKYSKKEYCEVSNFNYL